MQILQNIRDWMVAQPEGDTASVVDDSKLPTLATWMAGAFTLLASLLTFFGIKEGLLDRILRTYPRQSLLIFCLIGLSVLAGVVAPVLRVGWRVRAVVVLFGVGILATLVGLALPDFAPGSDRWFASVAVILSAALAGVLILLLWQAMIPVIAAALAVGLASLAFGLYGAVKLSVESKANPEEPVITARISGVPTDRILDVTVTAAKLEDNEHLAVVVAASSEDRSNHEIGRARVYPDAAGSINKTIYFGIPNERLTELSVRSRECVERSCTVKAADEVTYLRLSGPRESSFVGGAVAQGSNPASASLSIQAASLQRDVVLAVTLTETAGTISVDRATSRLFADPYGAISWTMDIPVQGLPGNKLALIYQSCNAAGQCDGRPITVATYTYPPQIPAAG
jgi:hypothetical protein